MLTAKNTDERNYGLVELWNAINDESTWDFRTLNRDNIKHIKKNSSVEDYKWILGGNYYFIYNVEKNQIRIDSTHKYCTADDIYFGILNSKTQRKIIDATIDDTISKSDKINLIKGFLQELFTLYQKSLFDIVSEIEKAQNVNYKNAPEVVEDMIMTHSVYWAAYSNQELLTPIINVIGNWHKKNLESKFMYAGTENGCIDTLIKLVKEINQLDDTFSDVRKRFNQFVSQTMNISGLALKQRRVQHQLNLAVHLIETKSSFL